MNEENILLGSQSPDADVLFYNKDKAFYQGLIVDNNGDILVDDDGNELEFEYVNEV